MDPTKILSALTETAPPVAAGIAVVLLVLIVGLKWSGVGFTLGSKSRLVGDDQLSAVAEGVAQIDKKITDVERRMSDVERDVEGRATREEVHNLELAFTRMEGRFEAIDQRTAATAHAVGRIENFMYESAMRSREGK